MAVKPGYHLAKLKSVAWSRRRTIRAQGLWQQHGCAVAVA
jgi:hypothetical protein